MTGRCNGCGHALRPGLQFCTACGAAAAGPQSETESAVPRACTRCGAPVPDDRRFCGQCGASIVPLGAQHRSAPPAPTPGGRSHSPELALLFGLAIPGAGQAYNGCPFRAFFLLFASVLILPWLYSLYDAYSVARRMAREGGRFGRGGLVWVFLQAWLVCNVGLFALIGLTLLGVLR